MIVFSIAYRFVISDRVKIAVARIAARRIQREYVTERESRAPLRAEKKLSLAEEDVKRKAVSRSSIKRNPFTDPFMSVGEGDRCRAIAPVR